MNDSVKDDLSKKNDSSILLLGDWVVDDSWQTGVYRSQTSLREGDQHLRAKKYEAPVVAFCAAGRLASILRGPAITPIHSIDGLGVWCDEDTDVLHSLFKWEYRRELSPDRLKVEPLKKNLRPKGINLHNLGPSTGKNPSTTTHAVRTYTRASGILSIHVRTDWETDVNEKAYLDNLDIKLDKFQTEIKAVVIKDILKGVVTNQSINKLIERYSEIPWFVSTKRWNADWLSDLKKVNLRVLFVPPVAATGALEASLSSDWSVESKDVVIDSWIAPATDDKVTKGAMLKIAELETRVRGSCPDGTTAIVIGPKEGTAIAKMGTRYVVENSRSSSDYRLVGWATAFFASLVHHGLNAPTSANPGDDSLLTYGIKNAIDYAYDWATVEASYLRNPKKAPTAPPPLPAVPDIERTGTSILEEWNKSEKDWNAATHDKGIIGKKSAAHNYPEKQPEARLELWRGMTLLDGYICFDKQKRVGIARLLRMLRAKYPSESRQQQAIQIIAEPGSGKSYLVKCLANAADLELCEFNITHLLSREELVSCFDKIATMQAEAKGRRILVFFDEINAMIDGNPVYDAFLSPLEDSVYLRKLMKFHLMPCFWLFAGTKPTATATKYVDFDNRMTEPAIELGQLSQLEKCYAGVQLIRQQFPDVIRVSDAVLDRMSNLGGSVREIKRFVRRLSDVRNSEVSRRNIPGEPDGIEEMVLIQELDARESSSSQRETT